MAFRNWRIGMHIQQDHIAIVALLLERSRWALRRWWSIPLMPGTVRQGIVVDVESLARQLQPGGGSCLCSIRRVLPFRRRERCKSSFRARRFHYEKASRRPDRQRDGAAAGNARVIALRRLCGRQSGRWLAGHRRAAPGY